MTGTRVEYVRIHSYPDSSPQTWKIQYSIGKVTHNGIKVKIGQASLDGNGRKRKVTHFNGFVTDWLQLKGCRIIGHDIEFFNFISPPRKSRYSGKRNPELGSLNKLMTWQRNNAIEHEIRNTGK